ncbi:MAG: hypothetical protein IKW90_09215 [Lachnospiraceae bacterium]|nr:hypothetical protein [Lachnospiraceae bacterium]
MEVYGYCSRCGHRGSSFIVQFRELDKARELAKSGNDDAEKKKAVSYQLRY